MGRSPCCEKVELKKGPWTHEEDQKLLAYIKEHGHGSWRALPAKAGNVHGTYAALTDLLHRYNGLQRCGKSCRLRWTNYLRPDIKRGKFTLREEQTIIQLHALLGNRWSAIAAHFPKRTDNEIKNYWNTHLKKRLTKMGIDPITHKPKSDALGGSGQSKDAANISHMAQWESARLEAEARLVQAGSKLVTNNPYQPQLGSSASASASASARLLNKATAHDPTPPISLLAQKMPPCLDVLKAWQGTWTNPTKDVHGIILNNSFFSTNGTLESPTSTLKFSENTFNNILTPSAIGYAENLSLGTKNYPENPGAPGDVFTKENVQNDMPYPIDATYITDTLSLPSFMESCFHDLQRENDGYDLTNVSGLSEIVDGGDFDENNNFWNNLMNLMTLH